MILYIIIRELNSIKGPEIDVFDDPDYAARAAKILEDADAEGWFGPQEHHIMIGTDALSFLDALKQEYRS